MTIDEATREYEAWVAGFTPLVADDVVLKHRRMAEDPFPFLRATFYRWVQRWPEVCPDLARAPAVLAVADLHVENFGTWRDAEGRLVWGVNDFDEACPLSYAADLVRLATSALLAGEGKGVDISPRDACRAILDGYAAGIAAGEPYVLAERHGWLRETAFGELRDPVRFWEKLDGLPAWRGAVPPETRRLLDESLPAATADVRIAHRVAGLGSLGRQRFVAVGTWAGGRVAREVKALVPSACVWAAGGRGAAPLRYDEILGTALRAPDPFVALHGSWLVRRLAPDCSRIELASLSHRRDEKRLLRAMGFETANVHLGSPAAVKKVREDLGRRPEQWLHEAAKAMAGAVTADWKDWRRANGTDRK